MLEHTAYAAHTADSTQSSATPAGVDGAVDNVAIDLYRAALGNVNTQHYLTAFARLDATGRVLSGWNWAAALCTLGWLVFWRLWSVALVYGVVLATGVGLLAAATLNGPAVPAPVLGGLALAGLLLLCVVPGLYADALLHMALTQRVARAVQAAPNVRAAADALQERAGSRSRMLAVALVGGLLLVLGTGVAWLLWSHAADRQAVAQPPTPQEAPKPEPSGAAVFQPPSTATPATSSTAVAATPEAIPHPAPSVAVQAAAPAAAPGLDSLGAPAASPAAVDAGVPPLVSPDAAQATPPSQAAPAAAVVPKHRAAKDEGRSQHKTSQTPTLGKQAKHATKPKTATPPPQAEASRRLYVNVGTFADADNAARAQASLRKAGLPVRVQQVHGSGGRTLQRVRVGPFTSTAQANAAVQKARALGLEAVPDMSGGTP